MGFFTNLNENEHTIYQIKDHEIRTEQLPSISPGKIRRGQNLAEKWRLKNDFLIRHKRSFVKLNEGRNQPQGVKKSRKAPTWMSFGF